MTTITLPNTTLAIVSKGERIVFEPQIVESVPIKAILTRLTCLSCGAKTNEHGQLPCGH